jgi:hypothetical protein
MLLGVLIMVVGLYNSSVYRCRISASTLTLMIDLRGRLLHHLFTLEATISHCLVWIERAASALSLYLILLSRMELRIICVMLEIMLLAMHVVMMCCISREMQPLRIFRS